MALHGLTYLDIPSHRAGYHYLHAEKLLKDGNNYFLELERVLKELNRAANLTPENPKIYIALAEVYRRALDTSSAVFALRFALEKDPTNNRAKKQLCELLINRAQETMKLGTHFDRASNYFDDALEMDPTKPNIWILKAVCDVQCQNFPSALHAINRAINITTEITIDMYILRAKILWAMGQIDAGNKDMRKVIAIDNSHPEVKAFINRAFANAEKQYLEAYQLFQDKKSSEAIKILLSILEINQNDIKLFLLLSKCYRQMGDLESAYKTLTNATKIYVKMDPYHQYSNLKVPDEIPLQQNIILNEMAMQRAIEGEYDQAILLLNKAISSERKLRKSPNDINFRFFLNRGDCYRAMGESLFAVTDYQLALERCPGNWDITTKLSLSYYNLAVESFNSSEYRDCKLHIEGAIALNPKIHEYFSLKGKAEYYLGEYHEAYQDYRRCLELNPENEEIRMRLMQFDKEMNLNDLQAGGGGAGAGGGAARAARGLGRGNNSSGIGGEKFSSEDLTMKSSHLSSTVASSTAPSSLKTATTKSLPAKVSITLPSLPSSSSSSSSALPDSISVSYCTSLLPSINPYLAQTMISSELLKERRKELNHVIHESCTSIAEKNELWKIMEDVKLLAGQYREPLKGAKQRNTFSQREGRDDRQERDEREETEEEETRGEGGGEEGGEGEGEGKRENQRTHKKTQKKKIIVPLPPPSTAIALKKRSEEISRQARLNPLVRGISSASSPYDSENHRTAPLPLPTSHSSSSPFRPMKLLSSSHRLGRGATGGTGGGGGGSQSLHSHSHSQLVSLSLSSGHSSSSGALPKRVIRVIEQN